MASTSTNLTMPDEVVQVQLDEARCVLYVGASNWQPFFLSASRFSRISAPGSVHFLMVVTCGLADPALCSVRRYSHNPGLRLGISTATAGGVGAGMGSLPGAAAPEISGKQPSAKAIERTYMPTPMVRRCHGLSSASTL